MSGWLAGGTFGYRWQFTNLVFGLEATLSAADWIHARVGGPELELD